MNSQVLSESSEAGIQGSSLIPLVRGEKPKVRNIVVSTPSLVRGAWAGLRATITADEWTLILAPEASVREDVEKAEVTFIVDGKARILKPFGSIASELYDLKRDPRQGGERDCREYRYSQKYAKAVLGIP